MGIHWDIVLRSLSLAKAGVDGIGADTGGSAVVRRDQLEHTIRAATTQARNRRDHDNTAQRNSR